MKLVWEDRMGTLVGCLPGEPENPLAFVHRESDDGWRMCAAFAPNEVERVKHATEEIAKEEAERLMNAWVATHTHGWKIAHDGASPGAKMLAAERDRQIYEEEWTLEDDDIYLNDELIRAAICYAALSMTGWSPFQTQTVWPWSFAWLKPSDDLTRNLVKAGALLAAEIDRRLRAQEQAERRPS